MRRQGVGLAERASADAVINTTIDHDLAADIFASLCRHRSP